MKKLFTLLTMLLLGIGSTWATDGSITLSRSDVEFQRNDGSGLNINYKAYYTYCFASIKSPLVKVWQGSGNIETSTWGLYTKTYTLSMLPGYTISSYVITLTPAQNQTFSVGHGTADVTSLTKDVQSVITVSNVNQNSTTFTFSGTGGLNKISSLVVNYSYTTAPTMVQTMEDLACADYSTCKTYNIISARSTFYAATDGTTLLTVNNFDTPVDANKKFAFIKNASTGKYYLYHVESGKFVNSDKSLTATPSDAVELHCSFNDSYPQFIQLAGKTANIRISSNVYRVDWDTFTSRDEGNLFKVEPSGTANLTKAYKIINGWTATYHIDGTAFTATGDLTFNGALSLPGTLKRAYCTNYKYYSDAECEHEITTANDVYDDIYVKYTVSDCPFEFSTEGSPIYYLLTGPSHRSSYTVKYLYSDGSKPVGTETPSKADAYQWAFIGNPYGFVIKNKAGNYISETATMAATGASFNLYQNTKAIEQSKNHFCAGIFDGKNQTLLNDADQGPTIACYTSTDGAIKFTDDIKINNMQWSYFTPMLASDYAEITYKMMFNGSVIRNEVVIEAVGATASTPSAWTVPAYCSFTCPSTTITAETTEIEVTLTWDGPFDISADFASAIWYYMKSNNRWVFYDSSDESKLPVVSTIDEAKEKGDAALWAFVGNPYNGVQVVNKAKGSGYYIDVNNNVVMVASGYTVTQIANEGDNGFSLSNTGYSFGSNSAKLILISSSSTDRFLAVRSYYCQKFIDDIYVWADANHRDEYFGPSETSLTTLTGNVATLMSNMSKTTYDGFTIPDDILSDIVLKYPTTGYYRIKNNGTGNYLAYGTPTTANGKTRPAGLIATSNNTDAASIIKLTGSSGTYKLSVQGLNIQSQTDSNVAFPGTDAEGVDFVFNVSTPGVVSIKNAASASATDSYRDGSLHEGTADWTVHGVVNWSASNSNSKWVVEDATGFSGSLSNAKDNTGIGHSYATLCVPFAISSISGASAYAPTEDGKYLTIGDALECPIAAGTPVILVGATDAGSYTANIEPNTAPVSSPIDTYALKGTFTGISIDCTAATGTNYVLGFDKNNDNRIGFYHVNSASYNLKPNRAYLQTTTDEARGFVLVFDDDATGIRSIDNGELTIDNATIYNLAGQRLNKMQKGINIVNGKKILF